MIECCKIPGVKLKMQNYSFYSFWVTKEKPKGEGGGGKMTSHPG